MIRTAILVSLVTVLAGCERSARTVEVQPSNQGVKPDTGTGGDTLTKTGRLALEITGFATSASTADVKLLINDDLETQVVNLSGGSGTALVSGLIPGNSIVKVRATAGGVSYSGSTSATIRSGEVTRTSVQLSSAGGDPNNGGTTPNNGGTTPNNGGNTPNNGGTTPNNGGNTPNNGGTTPNNGGNSDLDISIDIGGNNGGTQNLWDGKSFKGNSMFNIEPVK